MTTSQDPARLSKGIYLVHSSEQLAKINAGDFDISINAFIYIGWQHSRAEQQQAQQSTAAAAEHSSSSRRSSQQSAAARSIASVLAAQRQCKQRF